ncbi:MAG: DUF4330 domain-containing protein [Clostridia bacterium]|nr:DUF4330 domain-containing protein [Clostridia bacterium]
MRIIDEKGKLFGFINIIDLSVLLVFVLLLGAVGYKVMDNKLEAAPAETKEVLVGVKCRLKSEAAAKALKSGDNRLISGNKFVDDATIEDVTFDTAEYGIPTADGRYVITKHPLAKDIYVTFKMKANADTTILKVGTQEVSIGKQFIVKTQTTEVIGEVDSIQFK